MNMYRIILVLMFVNLAGNSGLAAEPGEGPVIVEISDGIITPGGVFNVATYAAPKAIRLGDTGLREAGLTAGPVIPKSDEIRIFTSRDVMNAAPLARIWLNEKEQGAYWFITGGEGNASDFVIPEGAVVVIWTKASVKPVTWSNVIR